MVHHRTHGSINKYFVCLPVILGYPKMTDGMFFLIQKN